MQAYTLTNTPEAIGISRAAERAELPVVLSFTVETDGQLPGGKGLGAAIIEVDEATGGYPDYYMVNCAHPSHFFRIVEMRRELGPAHRGIACQCIREESR